MRGPNLDKFVTVALASRFPHRGYVQEGELTAYLRWTCRYISVNGTMVKYDTLDIGSASVPEDYQRKGIYKAFLNKIEEIADKYGRVVFHENVLNEDLAKYIRGLKDYMATEDELPCFYRMPKAKGGPIHV